MLADFPATNRTAIHHHGQELPGHLQEPGRLHAAIVVDGKTMRHYVGGSEELAADMQFAPLAAGQTSIGVRFNQVF